MREIKFRGWSFDDKDWMNPATIEVWDKTGILKAFYGGDYVIEQWTGLKDKNGKDIYEGDIVSGKDRYDTGEVKWDIYKDDEYVDGLETWMIKSPFEAPLSSTIKFPYYSGRSSRGALVGPIEVIGNIHENPELLDKTTHTD